MSDKIIHVDFSRGRQIEPEEAEPESQVEPEKAAEPEESKEVVEQEDSPENNIVQGPWGSGPTPSLPLLEVFENYLEHGIVTLSFDSRNTLVHVPAGLKGKPQLSLNFSLRFGIEDFEYDVEGVRATLSFGGQGYFCSIPWEAVYVIRSKPLGQVRVFEDNVPLDMIR